MTPSRWMGAIAETTRTWPGARRSDHPQVFDFTRPGYENLPQDQLPASVAGFVRGGG